ncbi:CD209 antigen-like [Myxocyprinus asiaticus]|uniref:CD209 antigen-like n=1 Tax=Myxocyprinus asiaticus TaxID=70543 RepID=UPI00222382DB|nr:CD209 antigen-like [Myxocyprinus asiaticus]
MSDVYYDDVIRFQSQGMDRVREEMMVDIYESADSVRDHNFRTETDSNTNTQQPLQNTGSECVRNRSSRAATVCLGLLCVLLMVAVIVLCVQLNTNIHQCQIKSKNLTEERDQLLTTINYLKSEKDQLEFKIQNMTKEKKDQSSEHLNQDKEDMWKHLHEMKDGWIYYQFSVYYISSEMKSWSESRRYCTERGADLMIINNTGTNDDIIVLLLYNVSFQDFVINISGGNQVWIGLTDSDEEGTWKWVNGSTLTSGFWRNGEPNGYVKENCALIQSSRWHDYPCNNAYKWICEKSIIRPKTVM